MKRLLVSAALLVFLSTVARAYPSLLLKAVVIPCEANATNLELMEATPESTPCAELSTPEVSAAPEPPPSPAPREKRVVVYTGKTTNAVPPEKVNPVRLTRFEKPPVIDGRVDDEAWNSAALFKDFLQRRRSDTAPASARTEVRAGYDSKFIYFAFKGYNDPSQIRASVARLDSIFDDDSIRAILDAFNDKRRANELFFNSLGIQQDGFLTEGGDDFSVDIGMQSKGSLTEDGYVVEVAIPFKSLFYEQGKEKLWGIHFLRQIKHVSGERDSWMAISTWPANQRDPIFFEEKRPFFLEGIDILRTQIV